MLQPRHTSSILPSVLALGVAGPSTYRVAAPGRSPLLTHGQRLVPPTRAFGTSSRYSSPGASSSSPSPSPANLSLSVAALTAAPVASSPIPDTVTQLLLGSPLPAGWTIILVTLFLRSSVTLPMTLWQRARLQRTRQLVIPQMKAYNEKIALSLVRQSRKEGKTYGEYRKALKDQLATYQRALHKRYKTHPLPTMLVPLGVHIPLLIGLSLTIRRTVEMEGGWGEQGFWWLDKLGEIDGTGILPIVGGLVAFANAEVVGRKVKVLEEASTTPDVPPEAPAASPETTPQPVATAAAPSAPQRPPASLPSHLSRRDTPSSRSFSTTSKTLALPRPRPKRPLPSPSSSSPRSPTLQTMESPEAISEERRKAEIRTKFISNVMRIGAVLFIPIASQVPSALALYWTVSMMFTFVQNLVLNRLDTRDAAKAPAPVKLQTS